MKKVFLHGFLGEGIGDSWDLMVDSPAEALRAINCNTDNQLLKNLNTYNNPSTDMVIFCIGQRERNALSKIESTEDFNEDLFKDFFINSEQANASGSFDEIHFVPRVDGEVLKLLPMLLGTIMSGVAAVGSALAAVGGAIAGGIAAAGSAIAGMSFAQTAFMMVGSMLIQGIAASMFPPVKVNNDTLSTKSYMFGRRPNHMEQGAVIPAGYGMLKIGSNTLCFFGENKFLPGSIGNKTLETYTKFFMQDLLCEGPIEGFCDMAGNVLNNQNEGGRTWDSNQFLKSIYINDMPVKNDSNELNFMPSEDDPVHVPRFSLGNSLLRETYNLDSIYNPVNSRIEYQPAGATSALPGPKDPISGFNTKATEHGEYGGAKAYTHAITDRNVGLATVELSSEGQYHNWTDQRVRRRWFRRKVDVDKGTNAVMLQVAIRLYDGSKFISPILAKSGKMLEGVDNASVESAGLEPTTKYNISNSITPTNILRPFGRDGGLLVKDKFKFLVHALFDDARPLGAVDGESFLVPGPEVNMFTKGKFIYELISNAKNIIQFVVECCDPFIYTVDSPASKIFSTDVVNTTAYTLRDIFKLYFSDRKRVDGNGELVDATDSTVSNFSVIMAAIHAQYKYYDINLGLSREVEDLFKKYFHDIMPLVKSEVCKGDSNVTLGNDGNLYALSDMIYYLKGSRVHKAEVTAAEKASGRWVQTSGKYSGTTENALHAKYTTGQVRSTRNRSHPGRGNRSVTVQKSYSYWSSWDDTKIISSRQYRGLSDTQKQNYEPWNEISKIKNQGIIQVSAVTTSPASIDFSFQLPYIGPGEAVSIQLLRCTAEIDDPEEMATTSKRMSLKGIRRHKTVAGELLRFKYPNTAWIKTFWDSVNFSQVPSRNYLAKLKKVAVPTNYNVDTRTYIGPWDGVFKGQVAKSKDDNTDEIIVSDFTSIPEHKLEWTDNPAWILLDIMLNNRFGLGRYGMTLSDIDKWHLYAAAKFCDELVSTGFPLEKPKRYFETDNKTRVKSQNDDWSGSYVGRKEKYLSKDDTFLIKVYAGESKNLLPSGSFLDEFNFSRKDVQLSAGRYLVFFMQDGSFARRKIKKVYSALMDPVPSDLVPVPENNAQYIEICGPSFYDHDTTKLIAGSPMTTGKICLEQSYPLVEPRFSCNVYYNKQQAALDTVRELVAQFRTVLNYISGQVSFATEKKSDPVLMFADANVSSEGFSYAGASKTTRITAVKMRYIDKFDDYKSKVEYYEDPGGIDKFGYQEQESVAVGCSSRGQAQRMAKFAVLAPMLETEMVSFTTGMEGAMLLPGSIIEISDSRRFGENINGRVKKVFENQYAIEVDKIMSNLSFWDPETGRDDDRVELCVVCPLGFQDPGKIKERMGESSNEEHEQMQAISDIRRSQIVYYDGFISNNRRQIVDLRKKEKFDVNINSNIILSGLHGLQEGDKIKFSSLGVLPKYSISGTEKRLDETYTYFVRCGEGQNSSFSVSETENGDLLDFVDRGFALRQTYNSSQDIDANATISGGEHFYKVIESKSGQDDTRNALMNTPTGAVWSIRGFKKDVFLRPEGSSDDIVNNFILDASKLNARTVKGKKFTYYSDQIGTFIYVGQPSGNSSYITLRQLGSSGSGLGQIMIDTRDNSPTSFTKNKIVEIQGSLGVVRLNDSKNITVVEGNNTYNLFRSSTNTDIFRITSNVSISNLLIELNGKNYLVYKDKYDPSNHAYIRLSGLRPSTNQINKWKEVENAADDQPVATSFSPPKNEFKISIDDFRNVGRRQYRVSSVNEVEYGRYHINASEYNREKFDIIENEISINRPTLPIPPQAKMDIPLSPLDVRVEDTTYRGEIQYV